MRAVRNRTHPTAFKRQRDRSKPHRLAGYPQQAGTPGLTSPRGFHFHFTPTSSSWLNQVERWFALTSRMIRRGTFHTVQELEWAIYHWLSNWNGEPARFIWSATPDVILDKVRRCKGLARTRD
jgi:hypothetical protein